jgi:hypothetical protein
METIKAVVSTNDNLKADGKVKILVKQILLKCNYKRVTNHDP